jgi:hypothetical protein
MDVLTDRRYPYEPKDVAAESWLRPTTKDPHQPRVWSSAPVPIQMGSTQTHLTVDEETRNKARAKQKNFDKELEIWNNTRREAIKHPVWQPDNECERCSYPYCQYIFKTGLRSLREKHHCRCCGYIYCGECRSYTIDLNQWVEEKKGIVTSDTSKEQKVCKYCFHDLDPRYGDSL